MFIDELATTMFEVFSDGTESPRKILFLSAPDRDRNDEGFYADYPMIRIAVEFPITNKFRIKSEPHRGTWEPIQASRSTPAIDSETYIYDCRRIIEHDNELPAVP